MNYHLIQFSLPFSVQKQCHDTDLNLDPPEDDTDEWTDGPAVGDEYVERAGNGGASSYEEDQPLEKEYKYAGWKCKLFGFFETAGA